MNKTTTDTNLKKLKKNAYRVSKVRGETASRVRCPGGEIDVDSLQRVVYRLGFFLYVCLKVRIMFIWGLFESVFSTVVSMLFLLAVVITLVASILKLGHHANNLINPLISQITPKHDGTFP